MAKGDKGKKMRNSNTHGRGKKAGRGAGLQGGRGRAGAHKHRRVMLQQKGGKHAHMAAKPWGRRGFHSVSRTVPDTTINVRDLPARFPGLQEIDLTAAGITKLLAAGRVEAPVTVRVEKATKSAVEKIQAAGGQVVLAE